MKKILLSVLAAATVIAAGAKGKAAKDSVLMTVDGVPVTLSEFEYLYNKNNDQQLDNQTLEEYLEMFKVYKLKVAEARHQRVDTTAAFQREFKGYRAELVAPYLRDTLVDRQLVDEAYAHMLESVKINHMMVDPDKKALADSLRALLVANPSDFDALAARYSTDPSFRQNGGHYGYINAGQFPYEFEEGVYNTPVGQFSEVITTRFGNHLVQVLDRRPNAGEVSASHILITFAPGADATSDPAAKERIDSIYNALRGGADFAELARQVSTCPSAAQGGDLGKFGPGRMVPEFETVVYALADGEYSEPFTTRFGWHIAKRTGSYPIADKATLEPTIRRAIEHDERSRRAIDAKVAALKVEYGSKVIPSGLDRIRSLVASSGSFANATAELKADNTPLIVVADSTVTVADFMEPLPRLVPGVDEVTQLTEMVNGRLDEVTLTYEDHRLESKYPELRNLVNEYRDGMMLFEVSNDNVWNVPTSDPEGLENYFRANREKYSTWTEPRFKGYVIYATTDSLLQEVEKFLTEKKPAAANVGDELKAAFPRNIKIERVILPQGKNAIVDYLGFNGPRPDLNNERRWKVFTSYMGRVIDQPEEAADCRSAVSTDYQQELEARWIDQLKARYPVKVDKKVLKKVKPINKK